MKKNTKKQNEKQPRNGLTHKNRLGYVDPTIAGIDIGANLIHVAIPNPEGDTTVYEFGTTTPDLHKIAEKLKKAKVTTGVMEATGVYWIPLFEVLEELGFLPILVDAASVKNVPGRKSDVVDSQWIQTLYSCGMLRPAFRPPRDRLPFRCFVRQRGSIIKTRQRALLHMEKALQLMNIKLSGALSDIGGVSGMDIMRAIVRGERDPVRLASLRNKSCKKNEEEFVKALTGNFQREHIFSLKQAIDLYDFTSKQLDECDELIKAELEAFPTVTEEPLPLRDKDRKANGKYKTARKPRKNVIGFNVRELLWKKTGIDVTALDGADEHSALVLISELGGTDVSAFPTPKSWSSWTRLCPGNNISGGKRRKSKKQPCTSYINQCLRMCALGAKKSDSGTGAFIRSVSGRSDNAKGIKAGANKIGIQFYSMCKYGWKYHRKGAADYERAYNERRIQNLKKRASTLGYVLVPKEKIKAA
jgi:transposase